MEHRAQQAQEEIDSLMQRLGPDLSLRIGQFLTEREQREAEPEIATIPAELRKDYARVYELKAEIEDLKSAGARSDIQQFEDLREESESRRFS